VNEVRRRLGRLDVLGARRRVGGGSIPFLLLWFVLPLRRRRVLNREREQE
jgi:hypothetical protein